ncbi:MAG: DUF4129 domain-containing protein [Chloroflexi bacterium]|nr:DUF4129 domain-containing protein [Chloroflexota bacterium]
MRLYNDSLQWMRSRGVRLSRDSTPREVAQAVKRQREAGQGVAVDQMVECFEEADYSIHAIMREHFVRMYLAQTQLTREEATKDEATD